jgi:nicotinamidase-related amidase
MMARKVPYAIILCWTILFGLINSMTRAEDFELRKRTVGEQAGKLQHKLSDPIKWSPTETAVILCDVWDYHHSINAVRRLDEMLPRMNTLLKTAREQGATIIHAPSDCMPAYELHPARIRTKAIPQAVLPRDIASWRSRIDSESSEELRVYPIDQSDGGEDDDPQERQQWAAKLKAMGRNPALPWQAQSPGITIDSEQDFISDRGDEVWNVLQHKQIKHVMLLGVHTNMCVLGRPFGLRQMAAQGVDVVLVRDLTDCMYNPKRWPFVDHFTGNDLVIAYVERFVCPTITSDQVLGGEPLVFKGDQRSVRDIITVTPSRPEEWSMHRIVGPTRLYPSTSDASQPIEPNGPAWLRCSLRFPTGSLVEPARLVVARPIEAAWCNGQPLRVSNSSAEQIEFELPASATFGNDDTNLLVLQCDLAAQVDTIVLPPKVIASTGALELSGRWEVKFGSSDSASNIPLPAKFGMSPDVFYTLP